MISSEVQRTLVKSPPELWAELSDPDALARHLSDLGEIRITRVEPEERVEWEAPGATGTVLIRASGWGTRVTLSVSQELAPAQSAEPAGEEPLPDPEIPEVAAAEEDSIPMAEAQDAAARDAEPAEPAAPESKADPELEPAPAEPADPELSTPELVEPAGEPPREQQAPAWAPPRAPQRRGFFARFMFFLRGPEHAPQDEPRAPVPGAEPAAAEEPQAAAVPGAAIATAPADSGAPGPEPEEEPAAVAEATQDDPVLVPAEQILEQPDEASAERTGEAVQDLAEELRAAEESAAEHVTAILTSVLDRLGAAHHRPFSRA